MNYSLVVCGIKLDIFKQITGFGGFILLHNSAFYMLISFKMKDVYYEGGGGGMLLFKITRNPFFEMLTL